MSKIEIYKVSLSLLNRTAVFKKFAKFILYHLLWFMCGIKKQLQIIYKLQLCFNKMYEMTIFIDYVLNPVAYVLITSELPRLRSL